MSLVLAIHQHPPRKSKYPIELRLKRPNQPDLTGNASIKFALSETEQSELRWYMEDYLQHAKSVEAAHIEQIEAMIRARGEELYDKVLAANRNTQAIWFAIREQLADLRIEITTDIVEAAAIPWELMRDPESDSAIAVRVRAFVRVQSNPNVGFVVPTPPADGRIRLLYVVCRPDGRSDVALRAIANRLLQGLAEHRERFDIVALRPPTFEQLQKTLTDAKEAGRPFHIVHFDGHGVYADLGKTTLADWVGQLSSLMLGGKSSGKHGYLLFEHPGNDQNIRPVSGAELGKLLHDTGAPLLVLNACQSAMHEATGQPADTANVHDEVRAIGSLAQAVVDQGIPAVLGMRYSVFVVTAAQFVGELYAALAKGRDFGQAASEARKHLQRNPERWVGLQPRPLQDWFVPVIFEAAPLQLLPPNPPPLFDAPELDPVQRYPELLRHVPDTEFIGRDETLLMLDRAFDSQPVVLLHAYAGQGKTSTAVEFARWYAQTGGLGAVPLVALTSFERHTDLTDALNQLARLLAPLLQANGIDWHALNDVARRRQLVLQALRAVPVLWVWDNVEPVAGFPESTASAWDADEQQELRDFLKLVKQDKATKAKILLTSRRDEQRWLGGIPFRIAMPRMSRADAAKLVLAFGQERGWKAEGIADWAPLLDYCAGNPLTVRVVAGQAARQNLRGAKLVARFIQALRDGETQIADADASEGRDKSLGASLEYGFRHAFTAEELPVVALLHLFQGVVDVDALRFMGQGEYALPELQTQDGDKLTGLLSRACEVGLLTPIGGTWYGIHPALPWFLRQVFERHFDGQAGHSGAEAALRAWVEAVGGLGDYYHNQFNEGNRQVIQFLSLEEANLLHARRVARRQGWWNRVIAAMQGLRALYEYQGLSGTRRGMGAAGGGDRAGLLLRRGRGDGWAGRSVQCIISSKPATATVPEQHAKTWPSCTGQPPTATPPTATPCYTAPAPTPKPPCATTKATKAAPPTMKPRPSNSSPPSTKPWPNNLESEL
ncbi:CHAT domain-containing protein [Methylomagnum sp.]